jgi:DNA repair protein RAD7
MANLCPNLERLHLQLCGQLMADTLKHWGKTLKHLKRIELYAPFLVRKDGWESFIDACGTRLEGFLVTQSPRIDLETVTHLSKTCPDLTELRLAEIGLLDGDCLAAISTLKKLKSLDLSAPAQSLNDDDVISLLAAVGSTLEVLDLSSNADLTDATLLAVAKHCPNLRELYMRHLVELTNEGVAQFFTDLSTRGHPGLVVIKLEKGHDLQDEALKALLFQSAKTLERLSILGWRETTVDALEGLAQCKALRELDLGWCRKLTDFALKDILDHCDSIEQIRVWGKSMDTFRADHRLQPAHGSCTSQTGCQGELPYPLFASLLTCRSLVSSPIVFNVYLYTCSIHVIGRVFTSTLVDLCLLHTTP